MHIIGINRTKSKFINVICMVWILRMFLFSLNLSRNMIIWWIARANRATFTFLNIKNILSTFLWLLMWFVCGCVYIYAFIHPSCVSIVYSLCRNSELQYNWINHIRCVQFYHYITSVYFSELMCKFSSIHILQLSQYQKWDSNNHS